MQRIITLNRSVSWVFAFGYVLIHYAYPHRHGDGSIMDVSMVPRVFFMTSFVWMLAHVVVAQRMHGWPRLRLRSLRDIYVFTAWLVLFITTPIFSIPALGASQMLMAIAWPPLAVHLALNVWYLCARAPWPRIRHHWTRAVLIVIWLSITAGAAVLSFPLPSHH